METSLQSAKPDILIEQFSQYFLVDQPLGPKQILIYLFCCASVYANCKLLLIIPGLLSPFEDIRVKIERVLSSFSGIFICTVMTFQYVSLAMKKEFTYFLYKNFSHSTASCFLLCYLQSLVTFN